MGNPAIFVFRNCMVSHVSNDPKATSADYDLPKIEESGCQPQFDRLVRVLNEGYAGDQAKVTANLEKIATGIVVPAQLEVIRRKRQQSTTSTANRQTAFKKMAECTYENARQFAHTNESAEAVMTAAFSKCSSEVDAYVDAWIIEKGGLSDQRPQYKQIVYDAIRPRIIQLVVASRANALQPPSNTAQNSSGTGFFVSDRGEVMTNSHVVHECKSLSTIDSTDHHFPSFVLAEDTENDLALLRSLAHPKGIAKFRDPMVLRAGEDVVVFGYPFTGLLSSGGNVVTGLLTALEGLRNDPRDVQISAPVQPGNSGGALLDRTGAVIGVVQAKLNAINVAVATGDIPQNVNFAISGVVVAKFLEKSGIHPIPSKASALEVPAIADMARTFTVRIECTAE